MTTSAGTLPDHDTHAPTNSPKDPESLPKAALQMCSPINLTFHLQGIHSLIASLSKPQRYMCRAGILGPGSATSIKSSPACSRAGVQAGRRDASLPAFCPLQEANRSMKWDQDQVETDNGWLLYRPCRPLWFNSAQRKDMVGAGGGEGCVCLMLPPPSLLSLRYWRSGQSLVSSLSGCERQVQKQPLR